MEGRVIWPPDGPVVAAGAVLGLLGVSAGAFGAHSLEGMVTPGRLVVFETAARYHLIHAVGMVLSGVLAAWWPDTRIAGWLFAAGIVVFSGSLYLLVLTDTAWLGAVTPVGGLSFMAGWSVLAWSAWSGRGCNVSRAGRRVSSPGDIA